MLGFGPWVQLTRCAKGTCGNVAREQVSKDPRAISSMCRAIELGLFVVLVYQANYSSHWNQCIKWYVCVKVLAMFNPKGCMSSNSGLHGYSFGMISCTFTNMGPCHPSPLHLCIWHITSPHHSGMMGYGVKPWETMGNSGATTSPASPSPCCPLYIDDAY